MSADPFSRLLNAQRDPALGEEAAQAALQGNAIPLVAHEYGGGEATPRAVEYDIDPTTLDDRVVTPPEFLTEAPQLSPAFTDVNGAGDADEAQAIHVPRDAAPQPPSSPSPDGPESPAGDSGAAEPEDVSRLAPEVVPDWESPEDAQSSGPDEFSGFPPEETVDDTETRRGGLLEALSSLNPKTLLDRYPAWKRPVAVGACGMVVALVVAALFGGSPASETPKTALPTVVPSSGSSEPSPPPTTIMPKSVSANCPPGSTSPTLAFTSNPENAWRCVRAKGVDGAVLNIMFSQPVKVKTLFVMPGWNYVAPNGEDYWLKNRLTVKVLWRLGGVAPFVQNINPTRAGATLTLPGDGVATTTMSMTILKTVLPDAVHAEGVNGAPDGLLLPPPGSVGGSGDATEADEATAIGAITIGGTKA